MFRKVLLALGLLLLCSANAFCQSTTVSGTITDAGAQTWNNGTFNFVFVPSAVNPVGPYSWTGGTLPTNIGGSLSGTGTYSVSIPSNTAISPIQTTWTATFCSQASSPCFTVSNITITGATQTLNATPPTILINLGTVNPPVSAYSTSEITGAVIGSQFYLLGTGLQVCAAVSTNTCTSWTSTSTATNATNATNLVGPGTITGTFTGTHTESGNVTFSNPSSTFAGAVTATTINGVVMADQQAGADACAKINTAFLSLPTRGGIVDARGIVGAQTCAANPFASVTAVGGLLMLGNTTIVSNAQWIVPNKTRVVGIGRGGGAAGNGENTTIQAGASFPVSTGGALVRLGTGGGAFGTRLENLTLDCNGQTNCTSGIYSNDIEEKSGASYVTINNFTGNGIFVDGSGANFAQHYSFDNMEVQPLNVGTGTTIGIKLTGNGTGPYELRNITVIGNAGHQILQCVDMNGTTIGGVYNLHGEGCVTVLMLGDTAAVANLNVVGVEPTNGGNPVTTVISLNNAGSAAITLIGVARSSASGNTLTDNITTHTSTATFIGFYAIGNGTTRTIMTDDTSLVNITPTTAMVGNINMNGFGFSDGGTGIGVSPSAVNSTDLGATSLPWRNLWLGTAATNNFKFQPAATSAARTISIPDPGVATISFPESPNPLILATAPTIAAAGCGGSAASIATNNGTAAFTINVGTAPTSGGCTVTLPTATTAWACFVNDITTTSTSVFYQKQTGGSSTTAILQNFSDVAAATAPTASDIWRVSCHAY